MQNVGQKLDMLSQMYGNDTDGNGVFIVNLGGFDDPGAKEFHEAAYLKVGDWYSTIPFPVFFVSRNKYWSLCPDTIQSLGHLNDQMGADYVAQHWGVPTGYNIIR